MFEVDWPEHWKIAKLGDKAELKNGINFKKEQKGQGILTVDVLNMYSDGIYLDSTNLYRVDCKIRDRDLLRANDILFVRSSLKQEGVAWASLFGGHEVPMTFCGFLIRARITTSEINHEFLTHYFRTDFARRFLVSKSARLAITNISQATLSSCPIPLPPLPEQRAIAQVLQTIQEAKSARQRELALERERKATLMDYLFSYGTKGEPRKQTEIGEIPESWEVINLGEIVTLQRGKDLPVQSRHAEDIPIVGSNGIVGWHNESVEEAPIPGVATGRSGSIGLLTYINQPYWPLNTALYVRDFHGNNPLFVYYWLHLFPFEKYSQGVSVPTLNRNLVHPVPFRLPPLAEQSEIAEILQAFDTKIASLEQESERLDELFHAMLDELMTGKRSAVPLIDGELSN